MQSDTLASPRRNALFIPPNCQFPLLTVELYIKWYSFYLVEKDNLIKEIPFPSQLTDKVINHSPSPDYYHDVAEEYDAWTDELVEELITGRYCMELELI